MGASVVDVVVGLFDLGDLVEPPVAVAEAWSNEVFRVVTGHGTFAVKVFPAGLSAARRRALLVAAEFEGRARVVGIGAPEPVLGPEGELLVDFVSGKGIRTARCHRWVFGTPASQVVGRAGIAAAAGRVLGRLHGMNVAGGDTAQLAGPDQDRWEVAVAGCAAAGLPWAEELSALTPLIGRLGEQVGELRRQRRPMVISHRDFDPKNAVVTEGGQLIITDWDYAGPVVAGVELVTAGASFARTDEELREFVVAYREAGGSAEPADDPALSIEVAELDWLLRNVEAVVRDRRRRSSVRPIG